MNRNVRFQISLGLLILCGLPGASPDVHARGDASRCLLTLKRVEFKDSSGEWVKVAEPNVEIDLNTQDAGYEFVNLGTMTPGEYFNVRLVFSEVIRFAGSDGKNKTKAGGSSTLTGAMRSISDPVEIQSYQETAPTWNDWREDLMTQKIDFNNRDRNDEMTMSFRLSLGRPFLVKPGTKFGVFFYIAISKTVEHVYPETFGDSPKDDAMMLVFPSEVGRLDLIVDRDVFSARGDKIRFDY